MKLLFIYNADSGLFNTLLDIGHKALSPDTYGCNLCRLTHGVAGEHNTWKKYRQSSGDKLEFLHRDEFEKKYGEKREYPVVLNSDGTRGWKELIGRDELNQMRTLEELIVRLSEG